MERFLTVGVNLCYKSSITKARQMILSLFNPEMTTDKLANIDVAHQLKSKYTTDEFHEYNIDLISLIRPVQLVIVMDGKNSAISNNIAMLLYNLKEFYGDKLYYLLNTCEHKGVSVARNMIIKRAIGKWIKFCDDDDLSVNINELINIINSQEKNVDYIECLMTILTKNEKAPMFSGWYPSNVIIKTSWLKKYNLYFVPHIVGEDSIWRFDLYYQLHLKGKAALVDKSIYMIYYKSFKTTNENDINHYEEMIENIFNHEKEVFGKIPCNPALFQMISMLIHGCHQEIKVGEWVLTHPDDFEFGDIIKQLKEIQQEETASLYINPSYKESISKLAEKYYSYKLDEKQYMMFSNRWLMLHNCLINKHSKLNELIEKYLEQYDKPWMMRLFIHLMKKRKHQIWEPNGSINKYHKVIEDINEPVVPWMMKLEKIEYKQINSIEDNINYQDIKYSFVPISILLWCWFDVNQSLTDTTTDTSSSSSTTSSSTSSDSLSSSSDSTDNSNDEAYEEINSETINKQISSVVTETINKDKRMDKAVKRSIKSSLSTIVAMLLPIVITLLLMPGDINNQ